MPSSELCDPDQIRHGLLKLLAEGDSGVALFTMPGQISAVNKWVNEEEKFIRYSSCLTLT